MLYWRIALTDEGADLHRTFHLLHDLEKLAARFVEMEALPFAAEECRRGAEVAAHWAPDGGNDGSRGVARPVGDTHSQHSHAES